ncbi:MAG: VCBS repeat-containing protein [Rhodothermia bacterium]|nr:VCBS repeat-containing protein [Rhodothermia bacterium]
MSHKLPLLIRGVLRVSSILGLITILAVKAHGQTFTRITDAGPIVTDAFLSTGAAWNDFNGDGLLDMFALGENQNYMYVNDGNGTFSALTTGDFLTPLGVGNGALWGDFDNDGHPDLFIPNFVTVPGGSQVAPNALFRNIGPPDYTFEAVDLGPELNASPSASWVDYDQDGDLDLYSAGAAVSGTPTTDLFYRQDTGPSFTNITSASFVVARPGVGTHDTWIDFDSDGDQDLFVVNWSARNKLYKSLLLETGNPDRFELVETSGLTTEGFVLDIGSSWADYDNDGDFDVFLPVLDSSDRLYRNNGDGTFTRVQGTPATSGSSVLGVWGDVDNDGDVDLYTGSRPPQLYRNDGEGGFTSVPSSEVGDLLIPPPALQAGNWGDYDNDGDLDLYLLTYAIPQDRNGTPQPNYLIRNDGDPANHWITIRCVGVLSNRSGIGAKVSVKSIIDGIPKWQHRYVSGGMTSFVFHGDNRAHFGLGDASAADSLRILWPSGVEQIIENQSADTILTVTEEIPTGFIRANFYADQTTASSTSSLTVRFTDASLADPSNEIISREWDFDGDGNSDAEGQTTTWTFTSPRDTTYSVRLTVSNGVESSTLVREDYIALEGVSTGTELPKDELQGVLQLHPLYPNPVHDFMTVTFEIARPSVAKLTIHDMLGRQIRVVDAGARSAGPHSLKLDADALPAGLYLIRIEAVGDTKSSLVAVIR